MEVHTSALAWLYWDPPQVIFTIPFIDHPIVYYGLIFVIGFIFAYLIMIHLFKREILGFNHLSERDIADWSDLALSLKKAAQPGHSFHSIFTKLNKSTQKYLEEWNVHQAIPKSMQNDILSAFDTAIRSFPSQFSRRRLERILPKTFHSAKDLSLFLTDRLTWFMVGGTILGARLGHVFFYDWPRYQNNLLSIFKTWEGGLASHGGAIGVLIALFLYHRRIHKQFAEFTFINLFDLLVIPMGLVFACIRIGNFFNQEILGTPTTLPWAIIFGHPSDQSLPEPRHPVQLYESAAYFSIFLFLYVFYRTSYKKLRPGTICGIFLILAASARFMLDFLKVPQSLMIDESILQTGQLLSIPFILGGALLLILAVKHKFVVKTA